MAIVIRELELLFPSDTSLPTNPQEAKSVPSDHGEKEHSHQHEAATNVFSGITFLLERSDSRGGFVGSAVGGAFFLCWGVGMDR